MRYKGILFDMDGVLTDSEPVITAAACEALRRFGVPAQHEDFKPFTGMGEIRFVGGVAEKYGFAFDPKMKDLTYEIYGEMVDEALRVYPNTLSTLAALKRRGYALALASSTDRVKINHNLRVAKIPEGTFAAIIGAEDVERRKPFPDIYEIAAARLGLAAKDCCVIEDAVAGVEAGLAAGADVVAITTSFSIEQLRAAGATKIVADIGDILACL